MNKKHLYILVLFILLLVCGKIMYKNSSTDEVKLSSNIYDWSPPDQDGWRVTTDCRNIKLYFDGTDPFSGSGLESEQDIAGDPEKKILSIGLNERLYGFKKRLEVSYAQPDDYKNCSQDVKTLIYEITGLDQ